MKKNYPHILSKVYGESWLITPEKHRAIRVALNTRLGETFAFDDYDEPEEDPDESDPEQPNTFRHTQIIPIHGIIGNRLSGLEIMCGGCSLNVVRDQLHVAADDNNIERIILDFGSPGGTVNGVPEAAELIAQIAKDKEVFAYTETMMCSAAYWLASQCNEIFCTGSSRVGSIGVYSIFEDWTEMLKNDGIKTNAISAGEMKLAGAYFKEMTKDERAMFQAGIDKIYAQFKAAILSNRKVADTYMQGQVFDGQDAALYGLVDATADDLEDLIR